MEFLRAAKRRSLLSELIYVLLNISLAVAVLVTVWAVESPLLAFALVLLSKWRVLAVRPRFWFAHVQANTIDFIVSLSFVVLLYATGSVGTGAAIQIILTMLYIVWLLVIKPRTRRSLVVIQAGVALFFGTMALYATSFEWPSSLVVIGMWVIGYSAARHVLAAYSESQLVFLSFLWAMVMAELGWLAYHWTIAYNLPFATELKLPQVAIVALALSFLAERTYGSYVQHGTLKASELALPAMLSFGVIALLLLAFNAVSAGTI